MRGERTKKIAKETRMHVIREKKQQRLSELKGRGELHQQLVEHVQELQEHRRAFVGQAGGVLAVAAAVYRYD